MMDRHPLGRLSLHFWSVAAVQQAIDVSQSLSGYPAYLRCPRHYISSPTAPALLAHSGQFEFRSSALIIIIIISSIIDIQPRQRSWVRSTAPATRSLERWCISVQEQDCPHRTIERRRNDAILASSLGRSTPRQHFAIRLGESQPLE